MDHNEFAKENFKPNYWRHYRYSHDPFSTNPKNLFFIPSTWEEYLDVLPQFARYCNSLLLITGASAIGKATLIKTFINEHLADYEVIPLNATDCPGTEYLLQLLHEKFNAPYDENSTLPISEQLTAQLDFLQQRKAPRLLIIHHAEQLPLDMRQACLQIVQQQSALTTCLPIILVGDKQLTQQFNALLTPMTARECLHTIEISPLTFEQTKAYLIWTCEQAGGAAGTSPFTPEDIDTIFQTSQGAFGKINATARQLLAMKHPANSGWKRLLRGKLLWWGSSIIIIILLLYVYKYISQPTDLGKTFTKPIALREQSKIKDEIRNKQHKIGNMLINTQPKTNKKVVAKQPLQLSTPITKKSEEKVAPTNKEIKNKPKINKASTNLYHQQKAKTTIIHHSKISNPKANALFNRVMHSKLTMQRKRVLAINPHNYTLQLLATDDLHTAQRFILQHNLQATAMLVKTQQKGKKWYVIIYGIFPDKKQALQATKSLVPKLPPKQFWIRSYKSLHQAMQRTKS